MDATKTAAAIQTWLPVVLVVIVVTVVIVVLVKGTKWVSELFSGKSGSGFTTEQQNKIEDDVTRLSQTQTPTFQESQYNQFAETLYQAMNFSSFNDWWTNQTATIVNTMKQMKNDLDVAKLVKAYGARQLHSFGLADGPQMGLFAAINYDQPQTVGDINGDWQTKGISYAV